ncbi:MAG: MBL fold metallo-hydrolase [Actinomycetota bacterium]|nr:MBL fold metallo-hydrolase [Actinomycetota bacterium]
MARIQDRHPGNVAGSWYVDRRCIDCDVSRQIAPGLFGRADGQTVVVRQPQDDEEVQAAWRAAVACPTRSIGVDPPRPVPSGLFPQLIVDDVYYCGYASAKSFGANAFFARRGAGNVLVDSPRFARAIVEGLQQLGGIDHILLTHQDDVADADRFAEHFAARVWIHEAERHAAPFATDLLRGVDPTEIQPGLIAVPVPGHTRGSVVYLLEERFLFSGDSLFWHRRRQDLAAHRAFTWYSWTEQAESLDRLARDHRFEWVLAGHGGRGHGPADEMHDRLLRLVERMRSGR